MPRHHERAVPRLLTALCLALSCLLGACHRDRGATRIAVVPKGASAEFWKAIHAGAVKAGKELGVEILWKGPIKDDDLKAQIDVVQSFTAQGVSGITLAPLSDKGLAGAVHQATAANIPVIVFDSDLKGKDHLSFIATDNYAGGKLGGEELARLVGGKGNVIMLRYVEGSASTAKREAGFLDAMKTHPAIKVVSENQYGGATTESAFQSAESLLAGTKAASGGVDGVFCVAEATTLGMLLALEKQGLGGKLKFVGFDTSSKLVDGIHRGLLDAIVVQDPFKMGYLAVKKMSEHLKGQTIESYIDTGVTLVTRQNLDEPQIAALVAPDVQRWLSN
jgi:ribose transport system substrate-binding protein